MHYVVTDNGVVSGRSRSDISRKMNANFDEAEFSALGPDCITVMTERDIAFVQDKKRMSAIMFGNFFKKDNSVKIFIILNVFLTFLNLFVK